MTALLQIFKRMLVGIMLCTLMVEVHSSQPHIVLLVADDLGWNDIPWNNVGGIINAPRLEELANEGVILNKFYTHSTCTPSRAAIHTGKYAHRSGRQARPIDALEPTGLNTTFRTLAGALKEVGYSTHAVGKWHLGFCKWEYTPTFRGFDTFYGFYNGGENYRTHNMAYNQNGVRNLYLDFRNDVTPDNTQYGTYSTDSFATYVEDLLDSRNPSDPMFLYVPFQSVHAPLDVSASYMQPYSFINNDDRETYLGMVSHLDEAVGRIVDKLKSTGHYDNSVIVFMSDNGGSANDGANNWPLRGAKGSLWEGGTRVAGFVNSPMLSNAGSISDQLMHSSDLFETFANLAGATAPSDTDGFDQWDAISGISDSPRTKMVYNIDMSSNLKASVRIDNLKLIYGNAGADDWTLPPEMTRTEARRSKSRNTRVDDSVTWGTLRRTYFRGDSWLTENADFLSLLRNRGAVRIYDVDADPEETTNIVTEKISELKALFEFVADEIANRYVEADLPASTTAADPANFGDVWSPGWC